MAGDVWRQKTQDLEANAQKLAEERAARAAEVAQLDKEKEAILANLKAAASACEEHKAELANARADNAQLLADKKALEARVQDLENLVLQHHTERRRQLDDARAAGYDSGMAEGRRLGKREAGDEHFQQGVALCRSNILMSPPGQKFFEVILGGLPDAFLHSHLFRQKFLPTLTEMAEEMLFGITDQLGVTERAEEVKLPEVLSAVLSKAPAINPDHGESFPWYLDTFKAAAAAFRGTQGPDNYLAPGQIDYPVHRVNNVAQQNLQLAFDANVVRMLRRDVDRELVLRGQDPEEVLKRAEVVNEEIAETSTVGAALNPPGPVQDLAELPEGVGFVRVEPGVALPPRPEVPAGEDVPIIEDEGSGAEAEEPQVDDEPRVDL